LLSLAADTAFARRELHDKNGPECNERRGPPRAPRPVRATAWGSLRCAIPRHGHTCPHGCGPLRRRGCLSMMWQVIPGATTVKSRRVPSRLSRRPRVDSNLTWQARPWRWKGEQDEPAQTSFSEVGKFCRPASHGTQLGDPRGTSAIYKWTTTVGARGLVADGGRMRWSGMAKSTGDGSVAHRTSHWTDDWTDDCIGYWTGDWTSDHS
jgi:hypothetical protein